MVKELLNKLNVPSPLDITEKRVETAEEWEKARPYVLETMLKNFKFTFLNSTKPHTTTTLLFPI